MGGVPRGRAWGAGGLVGNGLTQGARTSGLQGGVPSSQGALASARHHPPILGLRESLTPSRGSVTSFPEPSAKAWGQHVCVCVCACVCACVCKPAPPAPPEAMVPIPPSHWLCWRGTGSEQGKRNKLSLSEPPLGKDRSHALRSPSCRLSARPALPLRLHARAHTHPVPPAGPALPRPPAHVCPSHQVTAHTLPPSPPRTRRHGTRAQEPRWPSPCTPWHQSREGRGCRNSERMPRTPALSPTGPT